MRILLFIGTRPEAIKMLPLFKELKKHKEVQTEICYSGQHGALARGVFDFFKITPDFVFDAMREGQSLCELTTRLLNYFDMLLERERSDIVLVHGDTATAFAASLSAFYKGIRIGHIEAGLRTYEARSPFPEELYRVSIDAMSDYHFAPTSAAAENLSREGRRSIYTVGNTVIDSFEYTLKNDYESPLIREADNRKILLLTTHRRENIGGKMREALLGIRDVLLSRKDLFCILPAHPNPSVRGVVEEAFCDIKNIKICEPLPVVDFHNILARSLAVLTDSGGVQEEASYLGVPVFLLRDNTERAEGRASGNIRIIGTERAGVKAQLLDVLNDREKLEKMSRPTLVFGDGTASKKISEILLSNG